VRTSELEASGLGFSPRSLNDALGRPFSVVSKAVTDGLADTLLDEHHPRTADLPTRLKLHKCQIIFRRDQEVWHCVSGMPFVQSQRSTSSSSRMAGGHGESMPLLLHDCNIYLQLFLAAPQRVHQWGAATADLVALVFRRAVGKRWKGS